ncbi:hypothetical protein DRO69_06255 [Candidatus Bathyarchaeota archaeon]|nr:MAG: hypothetical protein DRO69_06255 [Candidatus Bathyarchaeota archaeon]
MDYCSRCRQKSVERSEIVIDGYVSYMYRCTICGYTYWTLPVPLLGKKLNKEEIRQVIKKLIKMFGD